MYPLCILGAHHSTAMFYVAEQILVCLMGTNRAYKQVPSLANQDIVLPNDASLSDLQAAAYFANISNRVFGSTGWVPLLQRQSFGISHGANARSPLEELGEKGLHAEKTLWIRTDFQQRDNTTGESVPMTEFRRYQPGTAHYFTPKSSPDNRYLLMRGPKLASDPEKWVVIFMLATNPKTEATDGSRAPLEGQAYNVAFEVRRDGRRHPKAWARLADVGVFENSDQANSLAVRVEWEFPLGSGSWRYRYIQLHNGTTFMDRNVNGSLRRYAIAISMLHWLFGVSRRLLPQWVPRAYGSARVLEVVYDYMTQSIRFCPPRNALVMLSSAARSAPAMIQQMQALGLQNVGGTINDLAKAWRREKCDFCMCSQFSAALLGPKCTKVGTSNICTNCQMMALPCCSFTPGLAGVSKVEHYKEDRDPPSADDVLLHKKVNRTLFAQELLDVKSDNVTFEQRLIKIETDEKPEDSDEEQEESDEEGIELEDV